MNLIDFEVSPDESKFFDHISEMQKIHNEIGYNLSAYRDQIQIYRDHFVLSLQKKYEFPKPSEVMYDEISKRLRSVYHPEVIARKITVESPFAFKSLASNLMLDMLKSLKSTLRLLKKDDLTSV